MVEFGYTNPTQSGGIRASLGNGTVIQFALAPRSDELRTNCWGEYQQCGRDRPVPYPQQQRANFRERQDILDRLTQLAPNSPDRPALLDQLHDINNDIAQSYAEHPGFRGRFDRGMRQDLQLRGSQDMYGASKAEVQRLKSNVQGLERDLKLANDERSRLCKEHRSTKNPADFATRKVLDQKIAGLEKNLAQAKSDLSAAEMRLGNLNDANARIAGHLENRFAPSRYGHHRGGGQQGNRFLSMLSDMLGQLQFQIAIPDRSGHSHGSYGSYGNHYGSRQRDVYWG
jgi:hypothetical protein